jgi:ABC-type transport system involved in cytochrome bd biosynthesis fused ATPase/permease subunit
MHIPAFYIIAVFIMLTGLFSLRYEISFLLNNRIGIFGWAISILNLLLVCALVVVLLVHRYMNEIYALFVIVSLLILLLIVSSIQLISRQRLFRAMRKKLIDQKTDLIRDVYDLIDEKKREKIRKKYDKKNQDISSNGKL